MAFLESFTTVMPDADMEDAAKLISARKLRACGESCVGVNRLFVHASIHDRFLDLLLRNFKKVQVGWGKEMPEAMGPLIDKKTRDQQIELIKETVAARAVLVYGAFLMPTLLDKVTDKMRIGNIEIFGPILPVLTFTDLDDVIERANRTEFGLSSYLFTHDARVIAKVVEELEHGEVNVNNTRLPHYVPHVGIKESGIGRMLSKWQLEDFFYVRRFTITP